MMCTLVDGLPKRFNSEQLYYSSFMNYPTTGFRGGKCFISTNTPDFSYYDQELCIKFDPKKYNILLIGDSHAAHWNSAIRERLPSSQTLTQITASGCRPTQPLEGPKRCTDTMQFGFDLLSESKRFDRVIISANWRASDLVKLEATAKFVRKYTKEVVIIGRTLEYYQYLPRLLATTDLTDIQNDTHNRYTYLKGMDEKFKALGALDDVDYISLIDTLCPTNTTACRTLTSDGVPITFDYGHFTHEGAVETVNALGVRLIGPE